MLLFSLETKGHRYLAKIHSNGPVQWVYTKTISDCGIHYRELATYFGLQTGRSGGSCIRHSELRATTGDIGKVAAVHLRQRGFTN